MTKNRGLIVVVLVISLTLLLNDCAPHKVKTEETSATAYPAGNTPSAERIAYCSNLSNPGAPRQPLSKSLVEECLVGIIADTPIIPAETNHAKPTVQIYGFNRIAGDGLYTESFLSPVNDHYFHQTNAWYMRKGNSLFRVSAGLWIDSANPSKKESGIRFEHIVGGRFQPDSAFYGIGTDSGRLFVVGAQGQDVELVSEQGLRVIFSIPSRKFTTIEEVPVNVPTASGVIVSPIPDENFAYLHGNFYTSNDHSLMIIAGVEQTDNSTTPGKIIIEKDGITQEHAVDQVGQWLRILDEVDGKLLIKGIHSNIYLIDLRTLEITEQAEYRMPESDQAIKRALEFGGED
ncbi:MAG TPA: hypothetical protein PKD55_05390 [Bellilinea sp.]|nr:hypothetical protein [Bellilinea sp.]